MKVLDIAVMHVTPIKLFVIATIILIINACGSTPTSTLESSNKTLLPTVDETTSLNSLLPAIDEAKALPSPERDQALLTIAESMSTLENTEADTQNQAISQLLTEINTDWLETKEYARFTVLSSRTYAALENNNALYELLYEQRLVAEFDIFEREQKIILLEKRAEVNKHFKLINETLTSRIALAALLEDALDITQNNELIWQTLNTLGLEDIETTTSASTNNILIGWYELAAIDQRFDAKAEEKYRAIKLWKQQRPQHPAAIDLPIDLQFLELVFQNKPSHIALLLPLSGKFAGAAGAIRDGFFSAYYNESDDFSKPTVSLFDTNDDDIKTLYDRAVANGADFIIGPLVKEKVALLAAHTLTVPTLALNYSEETGTTNASNINFYQFGLSLEDEAKQVAHYAIKQGLKYALVIADSSDWSIRTAQSFIDEWQNNGGVIVDKREYAKDANYSNEIKSLLNISESQSRATQLKRLFGQVFEFEPRRRNDIDMIFLVARSREGRQIKPILNFHYASDVPVYATSQLFSSVEDTTKTRDLNGVRVITLPWVIDESAEKKAIIQNIRVPASFERLYALGHDAYKLHNRLNVLSYSPIDSATPSSLEPIGTTIAKPNFAGATGSLTINSDRRIIRQQPFIEVKKGKAERLAEIATPENINP